MNFDPINVMGGGGGGGMGGLGAGIFGFLGMERQNYSNAKQAQLNRDFQEGMSNTAHQREVADLAAAGLNPILSARHGGSSTPGGAQAVMGNSAASAVDARRQSAEYENVNAQTDNLETQSHNITADTYLKRATKRFVDQQNATEQHRTSAARWQALIEQHREAGARIEANIDREGTGDVTRRLDRVLGSVNSATSAVNRLREPAPRFDPRRPPRARR